MSVGRQNVMPLPRKKIWGLSWVLYELVSSGAFKKYKQLLAIIKKGVGNEAKTMIMTWLTTYS